MRRLKDKLLLPAGVCIAAAALLAGCANDGATDPTDGDPLEIRLKGIDTGAATRAGTSAETAVNLVAFTDGDMARRYFEPTRIVSGDTLSTTAQDMTLATPRYYPLGENVINLYAFTGSITSDNKMVLKADTSSNGDFILSNYGQVKGGTIDKTNEGEGTSGSSVVPAEILQFRHVMTKLNVRVEVDTTQSNYVDPKPEKVQFKIDEMYLNGYYPITSKEPDPGNDPVETAVPNGVEPYTAHLGVNYLVPTGLDLIGKTFTELMIDDYEATPEDLAGFKIQGDDPEMLLYPGYAYTLTLKIQKLRLIGVVLEQKDWDEEDIYGYEPSYDPHILNLNITGGYENTDGDLITRVVLHSDETRQYVGQAGDNPGDIKFVTLPADGRVVSADLYTEKGLLVTIPVDAADYSSNTLDITLSKVGMLTLDPGDPVNTPTNPYMITTLAQFFNIEKEPGGYYRQMTDLELEKLDTSGASSSFSGFGSFSGDYDGNGYWIGDLDISCPGLFAENTGNLINVRLYTGNMDLSGHTYAGSLCAVNSGLIYACVNETSLFGATGTVGGICGLNEAGGRIVASVNTGNIRAGETVGGICGENRSTLADTFTACLNTGNVSAGTATTGAIVGLTTDAPAVPVINTCFWLAGAVEASVGGNEGPVGTGDISPEDTAGLSVDKMRNGKDEGEQESDRILNKLNTILAADPDHIAGYTYILDAKLTGITWPMPFK